MLTYWIDLICLGFVVDGGGVNVIGRSLGVNIAGVWHSHHFSCYIFTCLENFNKSSLMVKNFERPVG